MLDGIEVLILLDLLGAKGPRLVNFFQTTSWMFKEMVNIEKKLGGLNLLKTTNIFNYNYIFYIILNYKNNYNFYITINNYIINKINNNVNDEFIFYFNYLH